MAGRRPSSARSRKRMPRAIWPASGTRSGPMRAESPRRAAGSGPWPVLGLMAAVILAWGLIVALALRSGAVPPEAGGKLFVLFRPGTSETTAFAAILGAGGAPVRLVWGGLGWIAYGEREGFAGRLEEQGALFAFAAR